MTDTMTLWRNSLERALNPDVFALLRPVVEHISTRLTGIPETAKDEIGERLALV
jgi:hypothetical protein